MQPAGYGQSAATGLDAIFAALADPTRRAILSRLATGEASVTELAEPFAMTQPAISKHLKVLQRAGLISRDRDAQRRPSRLVAQPLAEASEWLEDFLPTARRFAGRVETQEEETRQENIKEQHVLSRQFQAIHAQRSRNSGY